MNVVIDFQYPSKLRIGVPRLFFFHGSKITSIIPLLLSCSYVSVNNLNVLEVSVKEWI